MDTLSHILIDGCSLPIDLYRQARSDANHSMQTQYIGVIYRQPTNLLPDPSQPFNQKLAIVRLDAMRRHLSSGEHLSYITGRTREELLCGAVCIVILHITPNSPEK